VDLVDQRLVERVRVSRIGHPAVGGDAQLGLRPHLEPQLLYFLVEVARQQQLLLQAGFERGQPVQFEGQPLPEAPEVFRQFRGQLGRRIDKVRLLGSRVLHVVRPVVVRAVQRRPVFDQNRTGAVGEEKTLVRVEHDGIGQLHARQFWLALIE